MIAAVQVGIYELESHMHRNWVLLSLGLLAPACRDAAPTSPAGALIDLPVLLPVPVRMDLGTFGGPSSYANDVNSSGTVVGTADDADGLRRAFRWTPLGGMTDLGTLPGDDWSTAVSVTDDGQVLGVSGLSSVSTARGTQVIWSPDGSITPLTIPLVPGATFSVGASDFNAERVLVGSDAGPTQHAWIWSAERGKDDITASVPGRSREGASSEIDADGLVVGTGDEVEGCGAFQSRCWHAFLYSYDAGYRSIGRPAEFPTGHVMGMGLGAGPTVVGSASGRAYRWTESEGFTILPSVSSAYATSVNSDGLAVGAAFDPTLPAYQATAWPRSGGAIRLSPDDPNPQVATAVNEFGIVAGWAAQGNGTNHATVWLVGPVSGAFAQSAALRPTTSAPAVSPMAAARAAAVNTCASDPSALVSRGALLACQNR